jgi:hypothetical protein
MNSTSQLFPLVIFSRPGLKLNSRLVEKGFAVTFDESVVSKIYNMNKQEEYGARPIKRIIQNLCEDFLSEEILKGTINENEPVTIKTNDDGNLVIVNGGTTTTDPTKVTVRVNNVIVTVEALDGVSGLFTLVNTPQNGQTLTISYYSNELQDTADILPSPYVDSITKVGYSPGTSDFVNGHILYVDGGILATIGKPANED